MAGLEDTKTANNMYMILLATVASVLLLASFSPLNDNYSISSLDNETFNFTGNDTVNATLELGDENLSWNGTEPWSDENTTEENQTAGEELTLVTIGENGTASEPEPNMTENGTAEPELNITENETSQPELNITENETAEPELNLTENGTAEPELNITENETVSEPELNITGNETEPETNITENGTAPETPKNKTRSSSYGTLALPGISVVNVLLNATSQNNLTSNNLTCNYALNGTATTAAVTWYRNGAPVMALYMPFEGGSTFFGNSFYDYSGSSNNAVPATTSATWSATAGRDGRGAYVFDQSASNCIFIPQTSSLNIAGNFTITVWFKRYSSASWERLVTKPYTSDSAPWTMYGLLLDDANHIRMEMSNGSNNGINGVTTIQNGTWYFAAARYNGTTMSLYLNGNLENSARFTGTLQTANTNLSIG